MPIKVDYAEGHHDALIKGKNMVVKPMILFENFCFPTGLTVSVLQEGGLPTHGTIADKGEDNHNDRSHKIRVTKTGQLIIRYSRHVKITHISAEHCPDRPDHRRSHN